MTTTMLTLRLVTTGHGLMQADTAAALDQAQGAGSGMLALSPGACRRDVHVFGWSLDIDVAATRTRFLASGVAELMVAGRDRQALGRWLRQFGFTESRHRGHFDFLAGHRTVLERIESVYGRQLVLDNADVQRALTRVTGHALPCDGVLDGRCDLAARAADDILGTRDRGAFGAAFRRALALAAVEVVSDSV